MTFRARERESRSGLYPSVLRCVLSDVFLDVLRLGDLLVLVVPALFQLPARALDSRFAEFREFTAKAESSRSKSPL